MKSSHGGDIYGFARKQACHVEQILDMSANINPLGMSPEAIKSIHENLQRLVHYPDSDCTILREALSRFHNLPEDHILIGNGSTELIHLLPRALHWHRVLIPVPSFSEYELAAHVSGCEVELHHLDEKKGFQVSTDGLLQAMQGDVEALFLGNPNNPTGHLLPREEMSRIVRFANERGILVIVDEAFIEYAGECSGRHAETSSVMQEIRQYPNLVVLRSFTKLYGMPGLRVGYCAAGEGIIERLEGSRPPWSVNQLAQAAAAASLEDDDYIRKSRRIIREEYKYLIDSLCAIPGITVFPSSANYLLLHLCQDRFQKELLEDLLRREKIMVRFCGSFRGMDDTYIRIAIKLRPDNELFVRLLGLVAKDGQGASS